MVAGVVSLWENWEVQVLVLVSFLLQVLLLLFTGMRRRNISVVARALLWLAYLLADSIAIYILGHMSLCSKSHEHQQLVAFWAPFLLVHLGGQDTITAYSMEDNQLWLRHLLSLGVQTLGVAYVLCKYVAGSWTLVTAAALISVAGFLKYGERVWALKSSNLDSIRKFLDEIEKPRVLKEAEREGERPYCPRAQWDEGERLSSEEVLQGAHDLFPICMGQLVDYKFWPSRLQSKAIELFAERGCLYELIEMQLSLMYDVLHTKAAVIHSWCGCFIRAFSLVAVITTFILFQSSIGKINDLNRVDAIVTYILIAGAFVLEMVALLGAMGSTWTCALLRARRWDQLHSISLSVRRCVKAAERIRRWSGSIGQHKLMISRNGKEYEDDRRKSLGRSTAWLLGCKGLWHKLHPFLFSRSVVISKDTKELVLKEVFRMVMECGGEEDVMRGYNGSRMLKELPPAFEDSTSHADINFDEKILVWYFATKMFLSLSSSRVGVEARRQVDVVVEAIGAVSNYMMFLLVERPYMLPSPVRSGLCASIEAAYVVHIEHIREGARREEEMLLTVRDREVQLLGILLGDLVERLPDHESQASPPPLPGLPKLESQASPPPLPGLPELESQASPPPLPELPELELPELPELESQASPPPLPALQSPLPPTLARVAETAGRLLEMEARGEQEVRRVVLGVWVELLCYAAHHCSRDSHARQLNSGGEFITVVWLLSTAMFNRQYCDTDRFKKGVQEFFSSPSDVEDKSGWFHWILLLFCCQREDV